MDSFNLNPQTLAAITLETRACFLEEDAPGCLASLYESLEQLEQGKPNFTSMMHAAHSLKGGAGIAQLTHLSRFAHKLEDLMEILRDRPSSDLSTFSPVFSKCVNQIAGVLAQVQTLPIGSLADVPVDSNLEQSLSDLLSQVQQDKPAISEVSSPKINSSKINGLVKSTLTKDLEECLVLAEQELKSDSNAQQFETLNRLVEECTLFGEALDIPWLLRAIAPIQALLKSTLDQSNQTNWQIYGTELIRTLRSQREAYLNPQSNLTSQSNLDSIDQPKVQALIPTLVISQPISQPITQAISQAIPKITSQSTSFLRISTNQMDKIAGTVGELLVRYERLALNQQQLAQTNQNLRQLIRGLAPVQDQVQMLYDRLANSTSFSNTLSHSANSTIDKRQENRQGNNQESQEFDALELDQFTSEHIVLQNFQEIFLRIKEVRADMDFSQRELSEEVVQLRQELDSLYKNVTSSRLVPFKRIAQRYLPQLDRLCQQYHKSVDLVILGEEVLIDQVILEQLQTPLNHLLVNAFDHGIEGDRSAIGKPETAQIMLQARMIDNQVEIILKDDGSGIDVNKVHQKAIARKLCDSNTALRREEILNFIFQPGFSTTAEVTSLSGRGMGLDIVRSQITSLRGSIRVDTNPGNGTTFTIRLPLGLTLLPLLICRLGNCVVAFPSTSVLDIFLANEVELAESSANSDQNPENQIEWRSQSIALFPLQQLLAFGNLLTKQPIGKIILVLNGQDQPFAVTVDAVTDEKPLILKPFDQTINIPPYLAGCTILGTGQVVSVVLPQELNLEVNLNQSTPAAKITEIITPTILIAEDSIATRRLLESTLRSIGYEVIACRDGQDALETLKSLSQKSTQAVQLVITDIEMPRLNGFGLLQTIRTDSQIFATPVIMLTSRSSDRHRQKALSLGASAYLTKPFDSNTVLQAIQQVLQISSAN